MINNSSLQVRNRKRDNSLMMDWEHCSCQIQWPWSRMVLIRINTGERHDCSGFTLYVLKKAGIKIPRTLSAQYNAGISVSRSNLKNSDLVFFTRWGFIGKLFPPNHVGIYIGNGEFIHASSSGGRVRYDSLDDVYWKGHYKRARDLTGG